ALPICCAARTSPPAPPGTGGPRRRPRSRTSTEPAADRARLRLLHPAQAERVPGRVGVHPEALLLVVLPVQHPRAERQHLALGLVDLRPGAPGVEVEVELLRVVIDARPVR